MSNIHLYADEVVGNVIEILYAIKERGGLASNKFLEQQANKYQSRWGGDTVNIALIAIGRQSVFEGVASEKQVSSLVEKVKRQDPIVLHEIAVLRAQKGK